MYEKEFGLERTPFVRNIPQTADSWPRHIAKDRPRSVGQIGRPHNLVSYAITGGKSWPSFLPVNTVQIISFEQIEKNQVYLV